jgi:sugar phosphate isomerase/epimerase
MNLAFHSIHFSPMFGGNVLLPDVVSAARDGGFDHIGLDVPSIEAFLGQGASLQDLRDALSDHQLECTDLLVLALAPDRDWVLATAARIAEITEVVPAELCVVAVPDRVEWPELVKTARLCGSLLADVGLRLAVEYSAYTALSSLAEARRLCDAVGWDRAAILLDSLQFFRSGTGWDELAALDGAQLAMVQFSDGVAAQPDDLVDDSRNNRCIPGQGELPLRRFVDAVRQTGFDGPVTAEILSHSVRHGDPRAVATSIHRSLAEYWSDRAGAAR